MHITILAGGCHDIPALAIRVEHGARGQIQIMPIVGNKLIPPLQGAGPCIEYHKGASEQIRARSVFRSEARRRTSDWNEQLTSCDIQREGTPCAATTGFGSLSR